MTFHKLFSSCFINNKCENQIRKRLDLITFAPWTDQNCHLCILKPVFFSLRLLSHCCPDKFFHLFLSNGNFIAHLSFFANSNTFITIKQLSFLWHTYRLGATSRHKNANYLFTWTFTAKGKHMSEPQPVPLSIISALKQMITSEAIGVMAALKNERVLL